MKSNTPFKRIMMAPMVILGVVLMLIEEHLWGWLVDLGQWLGHLPPLRRIEDHVRALPPRGAATALVRPAADMVPERQGLGASSVGKLGGVAHGAANHRADQGGVGRI